MDSEADFSQQERVWEEWARADPLWAILSEPSLKGGNWDLVEFFKSGEQNIQAVLAELAERGLTPKFGRCLDFGCGVGRLTQALANVFDRCDGVDISTTMVELARQYNKHGDRCHYHVNLEPDLALFPDESFDFVYSTIVLQHNPPENAARYIQEFCRLLAPGGVAAFDMTTSLNVPTMPAGSHHADVTITSQVPTLRAGDQHVLEVSVTNTSGHDWPAGCWLAAGNHWQSVRPDGVHILDDARAVMPDGLAAGATLALRLTVTAPSTPGRYQLQVDVVEESIAWFADHGSRPATTEVKVERATSRFSRGKAQAQAVVVAAADPELFTMNGLPRERVEGIVTEAGCSVVEAVPSDQGGIHWEGYRYYVSKAATPSPTV